MTKVLPKRTLSSSLFVNFSSCWFSVSTCKFSEDEFYCRDVATLRFSHSVACKLGSMSRGVLAEAKIMTEFSSVRESPGNPADFHLSRELSVVIYLRKSKLEAVALWRPKDPRQSLTVLSRMFSSASLKYVTTPAANSESRGKPLNSVSIAFYCASQRTFSSPNLSTRFCATESVSSALRSPDFKTSASEVFSAKLRLSSSTRATICDS